MKVTGPALSISYAPLLRRKRSPFVAESSAPLYRRRNVTAGDPAPDPDCTGTYVYLEEKNGQPAYRRTETPYRLFWFADPVYKWIINAADSYSVVDYRWTKTDSIQGTYNAAGIATGKAVVSVELW